MPCPCATLRLDDLQTVGELRPNPPGGIGLERTLDYEEIEPCIGRDGQLWAQFRSRDRIHYWIDGREVTEAEHTAALAVLRTQYDPTYEGYSPTGENTNA